MGRRKKSETMVNMTEVETHSAVVSDEVVLESLHSEIDLARQELEATRREIEEAKKALMVPVRDIDADEQRIVDKQINRINSDKTSQNIIAKQKEYDNVKITGRFMNRRAPGQQAKLAYIKYADDPVKWYTFEDGKVYTIPRGFADQINEYYHTPMFTQTEGVMNPDEPCSVIHDVDTSNKKYAFVPIGF